MKLQRGISCALVWLTAAAAASAHDLGGRPHSHAPDATTVTAALLPLAIAGAAILLASLARRMRGGRVEPLPT